MSNSSSNGQQPTVESIMAILEGVAKQVKAVSAKLKEIAALQKKGDAQVKAVSVELKEIAALQKKGDAQIKETDVQLKETGAQIKATDAQLKETGAQIKATDAQLKETGVYLKNIGAELGHVGNQWGKVAEYLVGADFKAILKQRFGIAVDYMARRFDGSYQGIDWEIDIAAANGEVAVVGEVKVTMTVKKINQFVNKNLRNFHRYVPDHRHKKIYGLIAFIKVDEGYEEAVLTCAREHGLLIVRAMGDSFKVLNPTGTELRDYGAGKTS